MIYIRISLCMQYHFLTHKSNKDNISTILWDGRRGGGVFEANETGGDCGKRCNRNIRDKDTQGSNGVLNQHIWKKKRVKEEQRIVFTMINWSEEGL